MRLYKSGTIWCVWRWTITDSEYITRLHLIKTPWFAVCLHWINKPDPEPYLHDHPVSFLSVILRGGYIEYRLTNGRRYRRVNRWFNFIRATPYDCHTIIEVLPGTLTLALMGPKTREWGFHTHGNWTHWKDYYTTQRARTAAIKAEMAPFLEALKTTPLKNPKNI
jgi:hypothetical protein